MHLVAEEVQKLSMRKKQALILVVVVAAIWIGVSVIESQEDSDYCGSCHSMLPYHESWSQSNHASVGCAECHIEPGVSGWIKARLDLNRMKKAEASGVTAPPDIEVGDEFCLKCHGKAANITDTEAMTIPHFLHGEVGLDCASCHGGEIHGEQGTTPTGMTHATCIECHEAIITDLETCTKCHKTDWIIETDVMRIPHLLHTDMGLLCANCHVVPREFDEDVKMEQVGHDSCIPCHEDIIADPNGCATCHKVEPIYETVGIRIPHQSHIGMGLSCVDCHGPQVAKDGQELIEMGHDQCADCHEEAILDPDGCVTCHKVMPTIESAKLRIPHELHTEMGLSCADCHGPQVPAKGEDSFEMSHDTCVTCHESEIGDSKQCMTCHKTVDVSGTAEIKMPHPVHMEMGLSCGECHGPQVVSAGAGMEEPFESSHDLCISCHRDEISDPKQCMTCHKTVDVSGTAEIKMPHPVHMEMGLSCGECHGSQALKLGEKPLEMSHDMCVSCHDDFIANPDTCEKCHKVDEIHETDEIIIPHDLHTSFGLSCTDCHGPQVLKPGEEPLQIGHDQCYMCHYDAIEDYDMCTMCHKW